ncbi:MAG TPA: DNA-binding transcriptional regulator [Pirellulales bacterium]|nr:DNA-binding transcriptional regulator [Pirellulales bacterium]
MKQRPAVALLIETSNAYARGLLKGIVAYVREHRPWSIHLAEQGRGDTPPAWLARWQGDGIIARIENEAIARAVLKTRLPVVDVSAAREAPGVPWVETDDRVIARMAGEHLWQRGFRRLAFCGDSAFNWSNWRRDHFVEFAAERGCTCHVFDSAGSAGRRASRDRQQRRLADWIRRLPKPVGVMACYDIRAQQLLDVCRDIDVAVPEDVAVIGVDNDELLCDLSTPPLTSVIPNTFRTGYEAAALLDRLLAGAAAPPEPHLIEPLGIEVRESTDVLAMEDREVAAAVRFIREHACDGINVGDVLKAVTLSRRVLESRFRARLGRTPHEEIVRLKLERVKQLLAETDLSIAAVAERAGFEHAEYLSAAFKQLIGRSPSAYRRQQRASGSRKPGEE